MNGDRRGEHGQTIVLVAVSLFALLGMMALSIDVTTLYVYRGQAEQAVDAAALAGAKSFVTSGFTSGYVTATAAQAMATDAALSAGEQNAVAGSQIIASELRIAFPQTIQSNPTISVTFSRTGIPSFFAKTFGVQGVKVSASAMAEAYNPSGTSSTPPIQVAGVKPWLLANCDPNHATPANSNCAGAYFVDPATGAIPNSIVGQSITLSLAKRDTNPLNPGDFYPLDIPENPPTPLCPSDNAISCGNTPGPYYDGIACFNTTNFTCGESINGATDNVYIDQQFHTGSLASRTSQGAQCLTHALGTGLGAGQDGFLTGPPVMIVPGANNPNAALRGADIISRSDSVVTVPLFAGNNLCAAAPCTGIAHANAATIVGFLQVGIKDDAGGGSMHAIIMNASGCSSGINRSPLSGGNVSSVPVRLIRAQ